MKFNRQNLLMIGGHVLYIFLALVFFSAGGTKLAGTQMHLEHFALWGLPLWFMYLTGALEFSGALLLLAPRFRFYGTSLLAGVMIGAVIIHITAAEYSVLPLPGALLVLSAVLSWISRPRFVGEALCRLYISHTGNECPHQA